jgi:predicted DNA-binding ribbon-helix-helix protein
MKSMEGPGLQASAEGGKAKQEAKKSPEKILPPDYVQEKKRREGIRRLAFESRLLDDEFGQIFTDPERQKRIESLNSGDEVGDREAIGDGGVNAISRRRYEGQPPITAYVKPQSGETAYRYDQASQGVIKVSRHWDDKQHKLVVSETAFATSGSGDQIEQNIVDNFRYRSENHDTFVQQMADFYRIKPEQVPYSGERFSPRYGVDSGKGAIREYTASRVDAMLGLNVVPLTALRAEHEVRTDPKTGKTSVGLENVDIASAQEAAPGKPLDVATYREVLSQGPNHPGASSFMRIACLDYLLKSLDRHNENVFYDPATHQFSAIDNGLSMGLASGEQAGGRPQETDPLRSIPLSVIMQHPGWQLDDEARASLQKFHDSAIKYLTRREELKKRAQERAASGTITIEGIGQEIDEELEREESGKEIKYLTKLFRLQYENTAIADREGAEFILRLRKLLKEGRPPQIAETGQAGEMIPVGMYWRDAA